MSYIAIPPVSELKDYISHFWLANWDLQAQQTSFTYFATASSFVEMVFAFKKSEKQKSDLIFTSIQGQTNSHGQFPTSGFYEMFGVSLYSYAIPFLFHLPASEINNQFLAPETLLGNEGKFLIEKVASAHNTQERIDILTNYFKIQLKKQQLGDILITQAARQIKNQNGNCNIVDLSKDFCLSQKQFERRFILSTGFNPKLYARIIRFENILNNHSLFRNFTEAAYANGYYDQAHFNHDFKKFAGFSPKKFFTLSGY